MNNSTKTYTLKNACGQPINSNEPKTDVANVLFARLSPKAQQEIICLIKSLLSHE